MQNETNMNTPEPAQTDVVETAVPELDTAQTNLKAAREAKRMSPGDAAYALKISPRVIESLEAGRWADLPGRTFTVGILRAYGRLLDVSVDALIDTVPGNSTSVKKVVAASPSSRTSAPPSRRDGEVKRQTNRMLKSGVVMIVIAVLLAYVVPGDFWGGALQDVQSLYERVRGGNTQNTSADNAPTSSANTTEQNGTAPTATAEQQAQTGTGTLELRFAAPAWVEVRDYTGRIIYSQLNAAGTTQFITGAAPLDVMVGNAKQVQARWRDEPIKLDKLSGDDVARQILR